MLTLHCRIALRSPTVAEVRPVRLQARQNRVRGPPRQEGRRSARRRVGHRVDTWSRYEKNGTTRNRIPLSPLAQEWLPKMVQLALAFEFAYHQNFQSIRPWEIAV